MNGDQERYRGKREPFGRWLLAQRDRGDWVDGLAEAARADRTFPKDGDPEAVRTHLRKAQADGDTFQAVDDAETGLALHVRLMLADEARARLADLIAAQGTSQAELSRVLGRSDAYVSSYLNRKVPYDLARADRARLAQFLGVHPETLQPVRQRRGRAELYERRRALNRSDGWRR